MQLVMQRNIKNRFRRIGLKSGTERYEQLTEHFKVCLERQKTIIGENQNKLRKVQLNR